MLVAGLALSGVMLARSQVGGDQLNLLARGWLLESHGRFVSYGNPMSTGGKAPGGTTTLLVALPLSIWHDHHAPTVLVLAFALLAYLLLDHALRRALQPHERLLLAVLYWLNPWRTYFSAFLWNPNYLYLFGAVHLASALALRRRAGFWASCLHCGGLLLALQIHPSALLLVIASGLLWQRGYLALDRRGAALGVALAAVPLLPWLRDVVAQPALITEAHKGFLGRGLILVFPLLRGLLYWLRYASLSLAGRMGIFDFGEAFGAAGNRWLLPLSFALTQVVAPATVVPAFLANLWLGRRVRHRLGRLPAAAADRTWLEGYVLWTFAALVVVLCLSPTTFMYWQGLVLLHAAVLPGVLWLGALWRSRARSRVGAAVAVYALLELAVGLAMALGSPDYRCRGEETVVFPLRSHSPMFDELRIQATCPWPLDTPGGWWPDVLPPAPEGAGGRIGGSGPAR